jgi:opacity protein-like surface antigen
MQLIAIMTTCLASMSEAVAAQEYPGDQNPEPWQVAVQLCLASNELEEIMLPRSLSDVLPAFEESASFSIGPAGGYLRARGADRGTWFGGVQARLHFLGFLAAEAAITFHQNRYQDDAVVVTQYPVQLTAFLYIIPEGPIRPYILGGVGWYYSHIEYRDSLQTVFPDKTEQMFGEHLGAGVELMLGPRLSVDVDFRYIFLNPTNDQVLHHDFNYGQITAGVNLFF